MDLIGNVNNVSYKIKLSDITNIPDTVKTITCTIRQTEDDEENGNVVIRIDSISRDEKISIIEETVIDDLLIFNWIEKENKIPLLLNCITNFYLCNKAKINPEELSNLLHFAVNIFFDWDYSCNSFSEDLFLFRKFTLLSIPCTEMQIALYDEMITYFSERNL